MTDWCNERGQNGTIGQASVCGQQSLGRERERAKSNKQCSAVPTAHCSRHQSLPSYSDSFTKRHRRFDAYCTMERQSMAWHGPGRSGVERAGGRMQLAVSLLGSVAHALSLSFLPSNHNHPASCTGIFAAQNSKPSRKHACMHACIASHRTCCTTSLPFPSANFGLADYVGIAARSDLCQKLIPCS